MDSLEIILERYDGQMTQAEKEALAEEKNNLYRQLLAEGVFRLAVCIRREGSGRTYEVEELPW